MWPLLLVAQLLGGMKGPQGVARGRMPIPGAGAGYTSPGAKSSRETDVEVGGMGPPTVSIHLGLHP